MKEKQRGQCWEPSTAAIKRTRYYGTGLTNFRNTGPATAARASLVKPKQPLETISHGDEKKKQAPASRYFLVSSLFSFDVIFVASRAESTVFVVLVKFRRTKHEEIHWLPTWRKRNAPPRRRTRRVSSENRWRWDWSEIFQNIFFYKIRPLSLFVAVNWTRYGEVRNTLFDDLINSQSSWHFPKIFRPRHGVECCCCCCCCC